ncbi:MAG: SIS domain-containing protein [Bacteroidetes bacterium]|nr:SIS domain-containing protein [Bacteroidota bacterium]
MKYQSEQLKNFSKQIDFVVQNYTNHGFKASQFSNIVAGGLGGSGIGARIAKVLFSEKLPLSFEIISDYTLPAYVNKKSLVILSSYSGNTEETLSMFDEAVKKGSKIICITTGGKLKEKAEANGIKIYAAEPGFQPRMALGYPLSTLVLLLGELCNLDYNSTLKNISEKVSNTEKYIEEGKSIFEPYAKSIGKKFVFVADQYMEPVALRICQQIQENAKGEAFYIVVPESNHNVIETFYGSFNTNFVLLHTNNHPRVKLRFDFLRNHFLLKQYTFTEHIVANFDIETCFETIFKFDWFSLCLADAKKQNSIGIANINALKKYLEEN